MPFCFHPHQSDRGHCLSQKWLHLDSEGFCSWEQGHQWSVHANPKVELTGSGRALVTMILAGFRSPIHTLFLPPCAFLQSNSPALPDVMTQIWVSELNFLKEPDKNQKPRTFKNQNKAPSILTTSLSLKTERRIPYPRHLPSKTKVLFAFG